MIFYKPLGSYSKYYYYWYKVWRRSVGYFFSYRSSKRKWIEMDRNRFVLFVSNPDSEFFWIHFDSISFRNFL